MRFFLIFILSFGLFACADGPAVYAPVSDATTIDPIPQTGKHKVVAGETLYSIAWRYGLDYHRLAALNQISAPYSIRVGHVLILKGHAAHQMRTETEVVTPSAPVGHWRWPASGAVVGGFSEMNKGINIAGHKGDPVIATAAGMVVYSGSGLRGYGNLIIIEHNSVFLTAYAHNSRVYVKQGDKVKSGQKIAAMGDTGARRVMLHFEIRRGGKPVDPLNYLAKR